MKLLTSRRNGIISAISAANSFMTYSSPNSFSIALSGTATKGWDGTIEYSTDKIHWYIWDGTQPISSALDHGEHRLYMRGNGNTIVTGSGYTNSMMRFTGSNVSISGNIDTLLDWKTVRIGRHPAMGNGAMRSLFAYPTSTPSDAIVDVSKIIFPDRPLTEYCYRLIFSSCSGITKSPFFQAKTLATGCYYYMFQKCASLVDLQPIAATTLASECCFGMFFACSGLKKMVKLPVLTLPNKCYYGMYNGCTSLKISATQTGDYIYPFRIPASGTGTVGTNSLGLMFGNTGGTFTSNPSINTTYYTTEPIVE